MARKKKRMERLVGVGSRVPESVYKKIESEAREKGVTRSEIIRQHLTEYYDLKAENEELKKRIQELESENFDLSKKLEQYEIMEEIFEKETEELKKKIEKWSGEEIPSLLCDRGVDLLKSYVHDLEVLFKHQSEENEKLKETVQSLTKKVQELLEENAKLKEELNKPIWQRLRFW